MKNIGIYVLAAVVAIVVSLGTAAVTGGQPSFGGTVSRAPNSDLTIGGGTLTVTTSNTATSTIIGGCYQFYATSTATALKFQASTTPGIMYSQYGTCPNL